MICRYRSKTNLPPSFSSRGAPSSSPLIPPPSFPLMLLLHPLTPSCYSPQTITVFTSPPALPPHHGTSLLLSTGHILTAKPLEKRLSWKPPPCMWCSSPKHLTQIDFIWHFVSKSCTRRKKMYHVIVFFHLSNGRLWQCSRNKSKDFYPDIPAASLDSDILWRLIHTLRYSHESWQYTHTNTCVFLLKEALQF